MNEEIEKAEARAAERRKIADQYRKQSGAIPWNEQQQRRKAALDKASGRSFYDTGEWQCVRYKALMRSNGRCECCGAKPTGRNPLQVDHIKPRSKFPELELKLSNLQVLCKDCNMGKGASDETDWRKPPL